MKKIQRILSFLLALMIAASCFLFTSCSSNEQESPSSGNIEETQKQISITFTVVDATGKSTDYVIKTTERTLRGALEQENLISGSESEFGLMVDTVCGIRADYNKDGAYWALYIGNDYAMTGVDGVELKDGGTYKFEYTKG